MAVAEIKVKGDDRVTPETGGWATVSTFLLFFHVSSFSLVFFYLYSLSFPLWLSMSFCPFFLSLLVYVAHCCHGKGMKLLVMV